MQMSAGSSLPSSEVAANPSMKKLARQWLKLAEQLEGQGAARPEIVA
jgi:hypothetical protein